MRMPALHLLIAFEAVARQGSVSKAANELHLTPSAISHRIAKLEAQLGTSLFLRTSHGIGLTQKGRRYNEALSETLGRLSEISECLNPPDTDDPVRIHTGPGFARLWLMPRLTLFREKHPKIKVELSSSFDPVDFRNDSVDLWVQRGKPAKGDFVVENFFTEQFVPLASPAFLKSNPLKSISDLANAPLIYCSRATPAWPDWFATNGCGKLKLDWDLAFTHAGHSLQAAVQGLGVVLESLELSEPFLKNKRLVRALPKLPAMQGPGQHLIYPEKYLDRPHVAEFRSWLLACLS
ncbi:MAG: LysR family transcriptional regulator [Burkholderiaceae bacterium]|nr:LysR family transcriptional regulator [Burkholderiaceae bacterium]